MAIHIGFSGYILQPGMTISYDENKVKTGEAVYLGPASASHGFAVDTKAPSAMGMGAYSFVFDVQEEVVEGALKQVTVTAKDLGESLSIKHEDIEYTKQYVSWVEPIEGAFVYHGQWVAIPAVTYRCTRWERNGYRMGTLGGGGGAVWASPSPYVIGIWQCVSGSCVTIGLHLQEIVERWEVVVSG